MAAVSSSGRPPYIPPAGIGAAERSNPASAANAPAPASSLAPLFCAATASSSGVTVSGASSSSDAAIAATPSSVTAEQIGETAKSQYVQLIKKARTVKLKVWKIDLTEEDETALWALACKLSEEEYHHFQFLQGRSDTLVFKAEKRGSNNQSFKCKITLAVALAHPSRYAEIFGRTPEERLIITRGECCAREHLKGVKGLVPLLHLRYVQNKFNQLSATLQIFPFIEGDDLSDWMEKAAGDFLEVLSAGLRITKIVKKMHKKRCAHRDLKPENFVRTADGKIFIFDLDSLVLVLPTSENPSSPKGTRSFLSPERVRVFRGDSQTYDAFAEGVNKNVEI